MKLYGDDGSGSTRRVLAAALHMGLDLEEILIDLTKGENRSESFLALNPNGMIPTLVDGDVVLYEASAIMVYLAEKYGPTELWPEGEDRYQVLKWMFWAAEHFRQGPPILFNERIGKKFAGGIPEDPKEIERANEQIRKVCAVLEAHLQGRRYVVGDHVTLADIDLAAPFSQFSRTHPPYDEFPNIMAWHQRLMDEVPAWKITRDRVEARIAEIYNALGIAP